MADKKGGKKKGKKVDDVKQEEFLVAPWEEAHGFKGSETWQLPKLTVYCDEDARPGYETRKAHEYLDSDEVFAEKIKMLAQMIKASKNMIAYTGAGISTGAGIGDYATKAGSNSIALAGQPKLKSNLMAEPTLAHRTLTRLHSEGYLKMWIQQNHDGLPQKAGLPQWAINEIHGAWFDPSNPVVKMSGNLRDDLFTNLLDWEEKTDLCFAIGTSLSGMNADRVVETVGEKALAGEDGFLGAVIVSIQCTRLDKVAALRIFAKIDRVMEALAAELGVIVPDYVQYKPSIPKEYRVSQHSIRIQFDERGMPTDDAKTTTVLDLSKGKFLKLTGGNVEGDYCMVEGVNSMGHYRIRCLHKNQDGSHELRIRLLGSWWLEAGVQGKGVVVGGLFPVVNVAPDEIPQDLMAQLVQELQ